MKITIDGHVTSVPEGATIHDAALAAGVVIPTLCHLRGAEACTSCFVCVVKVAGREALAPACATPAADGMVVESGSVAVRDARRTALELLLSDHAGDCVAPCQTACPAAMDIPRMLRLVAADRWAEAAKVVRERIAIPATLGRVCPAPCEQACRRKKLDEPVTICALKAAVADADAATPRSTGLGRVVVVGAGPAGLSAAWFLRRRGHGVVVLEAAEAAGGGLRMVEASQHPVDVLAADVAVIQAAGVAFHFGQAVRTAEGLAVVAAEFDAVLLATGPAATDAWGLEMTPRGVKVDACHRTSMARVFAAGAAVGLGGRLAVRAGADALAAVEAIDATLAGREYAPPPRPWTCRLHAPRETELRELARVARGEGVFNRSTGVSPMQTLPEEQTSTSQQNASETVTPCVGHGRDARATHGRDARATAASRCLHCDCRKAGDAVDPSEWPCALRRWAAEYGAVAKSGGAAGGGPRREVAVDDTHELVIYDSGKCISCGLCVRIAKLRGEEFGMAFIGRGFSVRVGVPFGRPLRDGLTKCAADIAAACPTGAICLKREPGLDDR